MDGVLNKIEPFHRYVGKDMMQDSMYPFKKDTIPMWGVPVSTYSYPNNWFIVLNCGCNHTCSVSAVNFYTAVKRDLSCCIDF